MDCNFCTLEGAQNTAEVACAIYRDFPLRYVEHLEGGGGGRCI